MTQIAFPLLDETQVRQARELLRGASWIAGKATAGPQAAEAKNNAQVPMDSEVARQLQGIVTATLERSARFMAAALPRKLFVPQFNRYAAGQNYYGPHIDNAIRLAGSSRVRTDLSCTVFLSQPEEYDGGELVIHGSGGQQRVKLRAGEAILYPGTSVHEVTPVTRGERLACFFWVESMVRGNEQRKLLLELDDAVTALRSRQGETAEAVALTGVYHNLLRMWADT